MARHVIGANGVNLPRCQCRPQGLPIGCGTKRWVDLPVRAAGGINIQREVVGATFHVDVLVGQLALSKHIEGQRVGCVNRVHAGTGHPGQECQSIQCLGLGVVRSGPVPRLQVRSPDNSALLPQTPDPCNVLSVRINHGPVVRCCSEQIEQEAIIVSGQAQVGTFFTAEIHEELKRAHSKGLHVIRDRLKLISRDDAEVESEIDEGVRFHGSLSARENIVIGLRRHQVGQGRGNSARGSRLRFGGNVSGGLRVGDIRPKVNVRIDNAGKHMKPGGADHCVSDCRGLGR